VPWHRAQLGWGTQGARSLPKAVSRTITASLVGGGSGVRCNAGSPRGACSARSFCAPCPRRRRGCLPSVVLHTRRAVWAHMRCSSCERQSRRLGAHEPITDRLHARWELTAW
jgi:hypothetical protein